MSAPQPDSIQAQPLPLVIGSLASESPTELEREIVTLFDSHRTRLLAYVRAFGITGHDGEEIVQEVFLSLYRHLLSGKSRRNLRGWIFRVAHNLALKQRLSDQRRNLCVSRIDPDQDLAESHRDPAPNPEQNVLSAQRQQRLSSVVDALPEQDRLCLHLRTEGLSYREIAGVVGISLGSISISLTRSLARLIRAANL